MIKPDTKFEKVKKFSFGKIFYISLAVCALSASLFAWKSTNKVASSLITTAPNSTTLYDWSNVARSTTENDAEDVGNVVTNIPDERASETTTEKINQKDYFSYPLSETVSVGYSDGAIVKNETTGDWRTHNGTDFPAAAGDGVKAINNGIVTAVYDDALWGTVVEINHGNNMIAKYCGLEKGTTVSAGDKISANDKVGSLGTVPIEEAQGAHLHLEIRVDGVTVNPLDAMGKS